jgi:hypothetical protein
MNSSPESQANRPLVSNPALKFFRGVVDWFIGVLTRHRFAIGFGVITISSLFLIPSFNAGVEGDLVLYKSVANDLFNGRLPYRDQVFGYPPYAIPIFALPRIFGNDHYFLIFIGMAFLADWTIKMLLLIIGLQHSTTARGLLPVLCYSLAVPFIHFFYLQRYDVWPALICLAAVWLFSSGRHFLCGLAIAAGIGVKVYPAVFLLPLFVLAMRIGKGKRLVAGLVAGLLPIVLLSLVLPWWRFAQFQGARGLQCESLYASVLWLGNLLGLTGVKWAAAQTWEEVQGPSALAVLPWARAMFVGTVCVSTVTAAWAAARVQMPSISKIARLLLVPLLAFVAFNVVLSPQFMIWLLPLAALGSLEANPLPMLAIPLATILTPIFFPCPEYSTGLNLWETIVLLLRNLTLIAIWTMLIVEWILRPARQPGNSSYSDGNRN